VRVFDIERQAALAAAAAGDDDGILLHATAAIAAYRGELLPGMYDDWLLDTRSQLDRQCADLCDLVGAARARTGDLAGAVAAARRRVQLQPLEEVGYRTLIELQADLGDRAGAVSTYHHCASVHRPGLAPARLSAGPLSLACSRTRGRPRWRGAVVSCWSAVALAWGRPAWWPRSPR
jgi:two-component SAPR family response regulator